MKKSIILLLVMAFIFTGILPAEEKGLKVGGEVSFNFGDENIADELGPMFGVGKAGSIASLSLGMRNKWIQAGLSLDLAQGLKNVQFVDEPLADANIGETSFNISSAYLKVKDIFDVVDIKFGLEDTTLGVGNVVTSIYSSNDKHWEFGEDLPTDDIHIGLTLQLAKGLIDDFDAGIIAVNKPGSPKTVDDPLVPTVWGGGVFARYDNQIFDIKLTTGILDVMNLPGSYILGVESGISIGDEIAFEVGGEYSLLGGNDINPDDPDLPGYIPDIDTGMAAAGNLNLNVYGAFIGGNIYWKNKYFGSNSDVWLLNSAKAEFDSRSGAQSAAFDTSIGFNPAKIINMNLFAVQAGFGMNLTGVQRYGWNSSIDFYLKDLTDLDLSAGFSISQYGDSGLGVWGDPDYFWNVYVRFNFHALDIKAEIGQSIYDDPFVAGKINSAIGYSLTASVSF